MHYLSLALVLCGLLWASPTAQAKPTSPVASNPGFDQRLSGFSYPYPVQLFQTTRQGQKLAMAYMDVAPQVTAPRGVVVLLHGKNFSGFYFESLIKGLLRENYRVIVPDQIGFGKSTKPAHFQFSFAALAELTHALLQERQVSSIRLVGHSMGGMLATRYALMYPAEVSRLTLVNPIGLEDYKRWTGYRNIDFFYQGELKKTAADLQRYQQTYYYDGDWSPAYEALLVPALGWLKGPDYARIAYNAAQTAEMIFTQPVAYEWNRLSMPVTLILGQRDRTALGRGWAPPENRSRMGNYPQLGPEVLRHIPEGQLVALPGLGHMPFIEDFDTFWPHFLKAVSEPH